MPFVLTLAGAALLAFAVWSRRGTTPRARWWAGERINENAVLFWLPGLGLILVAAGFLSFHRSGPGADWTFWFVPLVAVGGALALWGGLFLPVPKWYAPGWTRDEKTTLLENRVLGLKNRRNR